MGSCALVAHEDRIAFTFDCSECGAEYQGII